jgi:hypothetical protein
LAACCCATCSSADACKHHKGTKLTQLRRLGRVGQHHDGCCDARQGNEKSMDSVLGIIP